jgi:hypothetical protein
MKGECDLIWSLFVDKKMLGKINLDEFPKFINVYNFKGKHYKIDSINWTNHNLNVKEMNPNG